MMPICNTPEIPARKICLLLLELLSYTLESQVFLVYRVQPQGLGGLDPVLWVRFVALGKARSDKVWTFRTVQVWMESNFVCWVGAKPTGLYTELLGPQLLVSIGLDLKSYCPWLGLLRIGVDQTNLRAVCGPNATTQGNKKSKRLRATNS